MSTRRLVVAAALVLLAAGCGSGKAVSLRPAERAFSRAGIRFQDRSRGLPQGQYFVTARGSQTLQQAEAAASNFASHVSGSAESIAPATHTVRIVYVMDSATFASRWVASANKERRNESDLAGTTVLVAKNVIYVGTDDAAARRAMAILRK